MSLAPAVIDVLSDVLGREQDVVAAYLFGSQARASAGPLSDVDVAVLLSGRNDLAERQLQLFALVSSVVASDRADVVLLNDAPVALAYRVLRDGRLLCSRDEQARIEHWVRTVDRYIDMAPFRRTLEVGQRHRLAEGRFGRS